MNREKIAESVARSFVSAMFEPPPQMVNDIVAWLLAIVAYRQRLHARGKLEDYEEIDWSKVDLKDHKTIPGSVTIGDMDDLERMGPQALIKKLGRHIKTLDKIVAASPKPVKLVSRKWQLTFKVDLRGWKYLSRVKEAGPEALKRAAQIYPSVLVTIMLDSDKTESASWYPVQRRLEVQISIWDSLSISFAKDLRRTIAHEMRHFSQDFLGVVVGVGGKAGLPSKRLRTPDVEQEYGRKRKYKVPQSVQQVIDKLEKQGITKEIFHDLDDVEFYTELSGALETISDNLDYYEDRKAALLSFVGAGPKVQGAYPLKFMDSLKRFAPGKWKKAVGEIVKVML